MIKIIYLLSIILLFIFAILVKKKEEKLDLISAFFIGIVFIVCFNVVTCVFLRIIIKNSTLEILSIINYITITTMLFKIVKDKTIQSFYFKIKDFIAILIITSIGMTVLLLNFGIPFNISFLCSDAANHYKSVLDFYNTGEVEIGTISGLYINYGLVFKVFFNSLEKIDGYYIFVILEIIKLIFSGCLFYIAVKKFIKTKASYIISLALSLIYMLAYPLNGLLCGFSYLQLAIDIICTMIIVMINYKDINNKYKNIMLFLLNFGLMFTYYILVPPVYIAVFIYELRNLKNNKKEKILNIFKIFFLPSLFGIIHFIIFPKLQLTNGNLENTKVIMNTDGYIFVNYITALIPFIPFNIYNVCVNIKNKKIRFLDILLVCNIFYIILALVLNNVGILSRYYAMKPYYMIWLVMLVITTITICSIQKEKCIQKTYKIISALPIIFYIIFIFYFVFIIGSCSIRVFDHKSEDITSMFDIYRINLGIINKESAEVIYSGEELKLIKEQAKNFDDNTNIVYQQNPLNTKWFKTLLQINNNYEMNNYISYDKEKQNKLIENLKNTDDEVYIISHNGLYTKLLFSDLAEKINNTFNSAYKTDRLTIYTNE